MSIRTSVAFSIRSGSTMEVCVCPRRRWFGFQSGFELDAQPARLAYMKRQPQQLEGMHPGILLGAPLVIIAVFMAIVSALT